MRTPAKWSAALLWVSILGCTRSEVRRVEDPKDAGSNETHAPPSSTGDVEQSRADPSGTETPTEEPDVRIPAVEKVTIDGMPGAAKLGEDLFGGQPTEAALAALKAEGYRTVVCVRAADEIPWDEQAVVEGLGMKFVRIPMEKPATPILDEWVDALDEALADAERPILFHCASGNRILGLWSVWMVEREGADRKAVLDTAQAAGLDKFLPAVQQRLEKE